MSKNDIKTRARLAMAELLDRVMKGITPAHPATPARAIDLSELEDRILLSASPAVVVAEMLDAAPYNSMSVETAMVDSRVVTPSQTDSSAANQQSNSSVSTDPAQTVSHEIVFLDTSVEDFQQLLDDLWSNNDPEREFEVVLLQNSRDGIEQITEALAGRSGIDAVHIVSHGTDASVKLGSTWLTRDSFAGYVGDIWKWESALSADADLLFYGCDLAASADGQELIESISMLTGADVAASNDDTGHAIFGADWELEYAVGQIETQIAFSQDVQDQWGGLLNTFVVTNTNDGGAALTQNTTINVSAVNDATVSVTHELVFVDETAPDSQQLLDDLIAAGDPSRQFEVILLSDQRGGIAQISEALALRHDLDAVHFVTHGNNHSVKLGADWLQTDDLAQYADQIRDWQNALSADADLLFYGCDLASDAAGRELLATFERLTDADVAASDDLTGNALLGGDWLLEYQLGSVETVTPFSQGTQESWLGLLNGCTVYISDAAVVEGDSGTVNVMFTISRIPGGEAAAASMSTSRRPTGPRRQESIMLRPAARSTSPMVNCRRPSPLW